MGKKYTNMQIVLEAFTLVILLSLLAYLTINWGQMPAQMPSHFNFRGQIDSWSDKNSIIFIPAFACVFLYILLTFASFCPKMRNQPVKITDEKRRQGSQYIENMLLLLKLESTISFAYITVQTSKAQILNEYFTPVFLVVIFGTITFHIVRVIKLEPNLINI